MCASEVPDTTHRIASHGNRHQDDTEADCKALASERVGEHRDMSRGSGPGCGCSHPHPLRGGCSIRTARDRPPRNVEPFIIILLGNVVTLTEEDAGPSGPQWRKEVRIEHGTTPSPSGSRLCSGVLADLSVSVKK